MNIYQLPEFLNGRKQSEIHVHHYRSDTLYVKNKVVLNRNLICILLNGTKEIFGSHQSVKINNTQILLVSTGNVLMWESIAEGNKLESLLIFFSNEILSAFCKKHNLNFSQASDQSEAVISLHKDDYLFAFERSLLALSKEHLRSIQALKIEELLVYLALQNQSGAFSSFMKNALGAVRGNKFKEVVAANISKGLSLDELAFLCNMSVSTFKRHFEKTFKCSPKKYYTTLRMERAKELLLLEKRPSEIYFDLQYQNLSSFSSEFKKYYGVSPKQFQTLALAR